MIAFLAAALCLFVQEPQPTSWDVDGTKREALVFAPSKPSDGKVPVVFDFHGHGGTARHAARTHHIHLEWPEALVLYPQGLNTPGRLTDPQGRRPGWQAGSGDEMDRDLRFFDAMMAWVKKQYTVDENRVYATGHSNGGAFTYLLWAKRGDVFAGFAPVAAAAGLYFKDAKPKPLFHAASEKDPLVTFAMQQRTLDYVKKLNGCADQGEEWAKGCLRYSSRDGMAVVIYLHAEGHKYPEDAPALIVKFFREQVRK